jgi:stress response protein SCP2
MTYTLSKGESADLKSVTRLVIGTAWDKNTQQKGGLLGRFNEKRGVDLDLVAVAMAGDQPVRFAGFDQIDPLKNGTLIHSGDNQTGEGDGDDETVTAMLDQIEAPVNGIVFCAMAFKRGTDFSKAANIEFNVYDASDGNPERVATYWPSLTEKGNAIAIAKVTKDASGVWHLKVLNEFGKVKQGDFSEVLKFAAGK